jgi:hypothetical protein
MYKFEWYSCARCTKFNGIRAARLQNTPDNFQHIGIWIIHIHRMLHRTYQSIERIQDHGLQYKNKFKSASPTRHMRRQHLAAHRYA